MSRSRVPNPVPREHPLTTAALQLAAEVRVLREAIDELVTEIQWQNQNLSDRNEGTSCPFATPVQKPVILPHEVTESSPKIADAPPSAAIRRLDGKLF